MNHHFVKEQGNRETHPSVKNLQHPRLGKPYRGMQIFDTQVDFPAPAQSGGIFLPTFCRICVAPAKAKHDRQTDKQTDDGQSDAYVALCFAGVTIIQPFSDKTVKTRVLADT